MAYFPMFVDLKEKKCLVAGGGKVAYRKIRMLREFGADVTVVAPDIIEPIKELPSVRCVERGFLEEDLTGCALAVAATDDREGNHRIASLAARAGIPVNTVDQPEDCSFIFPSYVRKGEIVAAFSTGGQSPAVAQYLKSSVSDVLTDELGEFTAYLGSIRPSVKASVAAGADRKNVYLELLRIGLSQNGLPTDEQTRSVIEKYSRKTSRSKTDTTYIIEEKE